MRFAVLLAVVAATLAGCSSDRDRSVGQTSFESAPPNGSRGFGGLDDGAGGAGGGPVAVPGGSNPPAANRTIEETDLYRLEGNRLYYLNSYRGLMVFDMTRPDQPVLLGRSPIFGQPVDMIVRNGVAVVVIGDWSARWRTARRSTARSSAGSTPPIRATSACSARPGWVAGCATTASSVT